QPNSTHIPYTTLFRSKEQAKYHFLSGFTAKLAGTERGITEPTPTFSSCFGAAFLSLHPTKYAEVLGKRMAAAGAEAYLVNTGWKDRKSTRLNSSHVKI